VRLQNAYDGALVAGLDADHSDASTTPVVVPATSEQQEEDYDD
jgi:hypothetical protein